MSNEVVINYATQLYSYQIRMLILSVYYKVILGSMKQVTMIKKKHLLIPIILIVRKYNLTLGAYIN